MDIKRVLQSRTNRTTRLARPYANFADTFDQCIAAGDLILNDGIDPKARSLIERSAVISLVTAIEVYYRDMLDFIFRYCEPGFFEAHLKHLLPEKFDIAELLEFYRHQVHPLELVSSYQSFQNADRIDKVFSRFLKNEGLWKSVLQLQVRIKDSPITEATFSHENLESLRRVFELRHELVHDPARRSFFNEKTKEDLVAAAFMVFGSDIVIGQAIQANRDPKLLNEADA